MTTLTAMAFVALNTLLSKLYLKLAQHDLSAGIAIRYADGAITATIQDRTHHLTFTDSPDAWCLDGRRNWRAIKRLCEALASDSTLTPETKPEKRPRKPKAKPEAIQLPAEVEAVEIPPAAIEGLPDDWQKNLPKAEQVTDTSNGLTNWVKPIPAGLLTREERKAALKGAPTKKGEPKPSPVQSPEATPSNVTPAAARSSSVSLASLFGSAKSGSKRAPQSHRANKRRPK